MKNSCNKTGIVFYEILVESPLIALHKNVHIEKSPEQIMITLNKKKTVLNKKGMTWLQLLEDLFSYQKE